MTSGGLPVRDNVDRDIESTPGLRRIDHRRGVIGVPEADAGPDARSNGARIRGGYRQTPCMRELTALQSVIDQIVAKDVSGDHQGQQVSRRDGSRPIP